MTGDYYICAKCGRATGHTIVSQITRAREWMQYYLKGIGHKPESVDMKCSCGANYRVEPDFIPNDGIILGERVT